MMGALPPSKRRSVVEDPNQGGYRQRSKAYDKVGSRKKKNSKLLQILAGHLTPRIERYQDVDQDGLTQGKWPLNYYFDPTADTIDLPCYLFELNSVANRDARNGFSYPVIGNRLSRNPTDNFLFKHQFGVDEEGVNPVVTWTDEVQIGAFQAGDYSFIDWVDIRLLLYGASKTPVDINVEIVSFYDEHIRPWQWVASTTSAGGTQVLANGNGDQARFDEFWLDYITPHIGNPIGIRGDIKSKVGRRVHFRKTFKFQPSMTTEGDPTPHQVEYKLFREFGRKFDYVDPLESGQVVNSDLAVPNEWTSSTAISRNRCHPTNDDDLQYLMITASAPKSAAYVGETVPEWYGSFDLIMRRKRTRLHLG